MLVYNSHLIGAPVLSVQTGNPIGRVIGSIVDPNDLKIIAFRLDGPLIEYPNDILDVSSIREYSSFGFVIDDIDELVAPDDVVKIKNVLDLNFDLLTLKAETKKGYKLGKIIDFIVTSEDYITQHIIVKRPTLKSLLDPELIISRKSILEVTDYKVIIRDELKTIKRRSARDAAFVPNFVNPFRDPQPGFASTDSQTPVDKDTE